MQFEIHLDSWADLEQQVRELQGVQGMRLFESAGSASHLLFRGQANAEWELETTLDRTKSEVLALSDYYRVAAVAKTQIETFTPHSWPDIDYPAIASKLAHYDALVFGAIPHYEYLVYLRHHGFPSPLLDWSRSPFVAAFFACSQPIGERVAIFVYQERAGVGKHTSSSEPQLHVQGPNVKSHPRHFLQQGEYTVCVQFKNDRWELARHSDVFALGRRGQDGLWKLTLPRTEAAVGMARLREYNITAFSLFQSEEALLQSLARELLPSAQR